MGRTVVSGVDCRVAESTEEREVVPWPKAQTLSPVSGDIESVAVPAVVGGATVRSTKSRAKNFSASSSFQDLQRLIRWGDVAPPSLRRRR